MIDDALALLPGPSEGLILLGCSQIHMNLRVN